MSKRIAGMTILIATVFATVSLRSVEPVRRQLSAAFQQNILAAVGPESPLELRLFVTPVKTDSRGRIITGPNNDPVKNIVGAESAGIRAGMERFTKILFAANYSSGSPDPGSGRIRMRPLWAAVANIGPTSTSHFADGLIPSRSHPMAPRSTSPFQAGRATPIRASL